MTPRLLRNAPVWLCLASVLFAASTWLYIDRVLVPHQVMEAATTGRPRGNLSDLYPRWYGARELLLHGRNPYSREIAREIQAGYYGRPLDSSRAGDPKDEQAFAYPVYVVFYLAPTIHLPFHPVQLGFFWLLAILTIAMALLWFRIVQWPTEGWLKFSIVALLVGSLPVVQDLKLQQFSLLEAALIAWAVTLVTRARLVSAGIVLALATFKPQLVVLLLLWIAIWTSADLSRRYRWIPSFLLTLGLLVGGSELYLPHWISQFWQAVREYYRYTGGAAVAKELLPSWGAAALVILALLLLAVDCWRTRNASLDSPKFFSTTALVLAITVLVVPSYSPYNQVLLFPAILTLARDARRIWTSNRALRIILVLLAGVLAWPWLASVFLVFMSLALHASFSVWTLPLWGVLPLPVLVPTLLWLQMRTRTVPTLAVRESA